MNLIQTSKLLHAFLKSNNLFRTCLTRQNAGICTELTFMDWVYIDVLLL